ncbi:MAG: radical SAM protein [Elusimicrobia bacterium]|nr:radical SAM protein [Elusimicrobiota bacterium]
MKENNTADLSALNSALNEKEYQEKKIELSSYPQAIFVQMDAPCNQDCIFCSRPEFYSHFDLDTFREDFEELLTPVFERVNRINLTGSGELLFLPEAKRNLTYFNTFTHAEKMFATNGSSLTPKMTDHILESGNRYLIHMSIHAASEAVHETMVKAKTHQVVMENLRYANSARPENGPLKINLIFVATTENIRELPEFVRMAAELGADGVVAYYNYVYRMDQKPISCYFVQDYTDEMIESAREVGKELDINLSLPPTFKEEHSKDTSLCNEAWSQIMVNSHGDIISCDVAGDSNENLKGKKSFMDVWNGEYYKDLRYKLVNKEFDCASFCWRANPNVAKKLRSHIITRGRTPEEVEEFLKE